MILGRRSRSWRRLLGLTSSAGTAMRGRMKSREALCRDGDHAVGSHYRWRRLQGKSGMAWSSAADKNIPLRAYPKSPLQRRHPAPMRGAYRDRHGRWARDAMDAAVSGANGIAGRASARERPAGAQTTGA